MPRNAIKYKDVWVAPGSRMYFLLVEKKDAKAAEELYRQVMKRYT